MNPRGRNRLISGFVAIAMTLAAVPAAEAASSFISHLTTVTDGAASAPASGPEAGDQNPYGVAVVPKSIGNLVKGDILVSNFNNVGSSPSGNLQGTGSSIVQYSPDAQSQTTFAEISPTTSECPGGVGLTTALVVLRNGWVIVGSLPTTDGTIVTVGAGCLIVLDSKGNTVETFSGGLINGPWDMTATDNGNSATLYFTNVLNGDVAEADPDTPVKAGTVVRMLLFTPPERLGKPRIILSTIIGSGFPEENDPNALIIGPTGVGLGRNDTLYVADSVSSRIAAIPHASTRFRSAGTGQTVTSGDNLMTPLGLAIAPNHDILTVNGGDGNIVETTPNGGQFINTPANPISPGGAGALFGLAVAPGGNAIYFVDDSENTLNLLH
jgi:sugar lactone lactonase YvrE